MLFLETERLLLRNVKPEDAATIYDYRNNALCARYQRGQTKDYEGIAALVEKRKADVLSVEGPCFIAVAEKETDELLGEIVVMPNEGTISLGYTFSYKHHRKGYAFEALSSLIKLLHSRYPAWEFISFTDRENAASRSLLAKLGYKDMGYLAKKDSQVYGKYTTAETDAEIAQVTEKDSAC